MFWKIFTWKKSQNGGLNEAMECLDAAEKVYDNGFGYYLHFR